MPRPNRPRTINSETVLARRIAAERAARLPEMTLERLAERMDAEGCPIDPSALHRIEKGKRDIKVNELVAFARVFGVPVARLLLPPELAAQKRAFDLWEKREALMREIQEAHEKLDNIDSRLLDLVDAEQSPAVLEALRGKVGTDLGETLAHMRLTRGHAASESSEGDS